jgi:ABC-type phosphate/phosphonate transport system ATPase subunit
MNREANTTTTTVRRRVLIARMMLRLSRACFAGPVSVQGPSVAESRLRVGDELSQHREYALIEVLHRLAVRATFFALFGMFCVPFVDGAIEYAGRTM